MAQWGQSALWAYPSTTLELAKGASEAVHVTLFGDASNEAGQIWRRKRDRAVHERWDEEVEIFGFDTERSSLLTYLLEGGKERSITSIVGESGMGKSTLARSVYDSSNVRKSFKALPRLKLKAHKKFLKPLI
uniref:NB-ARC domain-containing protein n=1 Tax=Oryza glumipatula TaxID=40148 RepID=A0A0E0A439_9ORYZ